VHTHALQAEDEFLVVACDGLWDVLSSQRCVELARAHLRENNSPELCAQHLVRRPARAPARLRACRNDSALMWWRAAARRACELCCRRV
jgi:serine/threonine protein phosphatase PrpC